MNINGQIKLEAIPNTSRVFNVTSADGVWQARITTHESEGVHVNRGYLGLSQLQAIKSEMTNINAGRSSLLIK
jgi:hypothetical protein